MDAISDQSLSNLKKRHVTITMDESPSIYLFSIMCSLIELHDLWMHRCMAQLILLLLHDMQRVIKFSYLWKLPNILCIGKVVSMNEWCLNSLSSQDTTHRNYGLRLALLDACAYVATQIILELEALMVVLCSLLFSLFFFISFIYPFFPIFLISFLFYRLFPSSFIIFYFPLSSLFFLPLLSFIFHYFNFAFFFFFILISFSFLMFQYDKNDF